MSAKDLELGTLIVVILKARNLNDKHSIRKQDAFAQATLNGVTKKTHVDIKGGQHPEWDAELRFAVLENGAGKPRKLEVACFSKEPRSDDLLGRGTVDISDTLKTGEFDDWISLDIDGVARGELYLEMTYYANSVAPAVAMGGLAVPSYLKEGVQRRPSKLLRSDRLSRPSQAINFPPPQNSTSTQVRKSTPNYALPILPPSLAPARPTPTPNIRNEPHHSRRPTDVLQHKISNQATGVPISSLDSSRNPLTAPLPSILRPGSAQPPTSSNSPPSGHIRQLSTAPPSLNNPYVLPAVTASQQYIHGVIPPGAQNGQPSPYHTHNPYPVSTSINPYITNTSPTQSRVDTVASPTFVSGGFYIPAPALPPVRETNPYMSTYPPTIEQHIPPRGREFDPYGQHLPTRYQTPLPLPQRSPPAGRAFSPTVGPDVARLEALRRVEEDAAQRRQQELKDLELALQLDRELNLT